MNEIEQAIDRMTVSEIDGNGLQYYAGYLEPIQLDARGLIHNTKAFSVWIDHKRNKSTLFWETWLHGAPSNLQEVEVIKDEVLVPEEVPALLKKYGRGPQEEEGE